MLTLAYSCKQDTKSVASVGYKNIDMDQFLKMQGQDYTLLDVRTPDEFRSGNISKSINIDYNSESFKETLGKIHKSRPYIVYCQKGGRSSKACEIMVELGFRDVTNLEGGYSEYPASSK